MATQVSLNSGAVASAGALAIQTNGTTEAVSISTGQVATLAKDAVIQGVTVGRGAGAVASNTAVGASALAANTTGAQNTAVGIQALQSTTSGDNNTAVGRLALKSNTTGASNTAVGRDALQINTTGSENSAVGLFALFNNTTGANNSALGVQALNANTTASNNTAVGYQAGYALNATFNVCVGYLAGSLVTSGVGNTIVGSLAGQFGGSTGPTTGSYNTLLGYGTRVGTGDTGSIVIGAPGSDNAVTGKGSSTGFINANGGGVYQGNNSSTWSTTSDQRLKKNIADNTDGLSKITAIRVRNFQYRLPEEVTELDSSCAVANTGVQLGVIAQELQQVLPECVKTESTGVMSVDTDNLTWYLVNAIKELKAEVDSLKAQINGASA